jgi:hypothetical protein
MCAYSLGVYYQSKNDLVIEMIQSFPATKDETVVYELMYYLNTSQMLPRSLF